MLLVLVTVLASNPAPVERWTFRTRLDLGDLMLSSWYVPEGRAHIERALQQAQGLFRSGADPDGMTLAYAAPIMGPWLAARETIEPLDRVMLITSGVLQTIGFGVATARLLSETEAGVVETGPVLALSPIAGGHLGLSLSVTGF